MKIKDHPKGFEDVIKQETSLICSLDHGSNSHTQWIFTFVNQEVYGGGEKNDGYHFLRTKIDGKNVDIEMPADLIHLIFSRQMAMRGYKNDGFTEGGEKLIDIAWDDWRSK